MFRTPYLSALALVASDSFEPRHSSHVCFMANETTTSTMAGGINASLVQPTVILALSERPGLAVRVCREFDLTGQGTGTAKIPTQTSYWGAPQDRGAGVDTEFDGAEGTDAGNTAFTLGNIPISTPEYVVAHALSDSAQEDLALDDAAILSLMTTTMVNVLQIALDDDLVAMFAGLSQGVGTSGTDLSLAQALSATHGIIRRGANCEAMEFVLDPEQVENIRTAILSTNAAASVLQITADRLIGFQRMDGQSRGQGRVMMLDGCLVTLSGLTDTANTGADVVGAAFVPTSAYNDANGATTFGLAWKRLPRLEFERRAKGRATDIVVSMRAGLAELQDGAGTSITTDAP